MLFPTTASYCQGPSLIIMALIYRNINNTTVTPRIYDHINLSQISTNEHSKMKLNYKYIHASACDGKKFTKKRRKSKNHNCNKNGSIFSQQRAFTLKYEPFLHFILWKS